MNEVGDESELIEIIEIGQDYGLGVILVENTYENVRVGTRFEG